MTQINTEKSGGVDMSWIEDFLVSDEEMAKISDPKWIIPNLIIQGHFIVIPAPPNGGKTTIMLHLAGEMTAEDSQVYYVNSDVSGADAKSMHQQANKYGFTLMLPDFQRGLSMENVVQKLQMMANQNGDYSNMVFIFDTLKKMTDVINKARSKELYKTLRSLTAKGMTVICLAHTNKYESKDGQQVFEGTNDLRADVDEMIFLEALKRGDGSLIVSTRPDKVRGEFKPITFEISPRREVQLIDYVDVSEQEKEKQLLEDDSIGIKLIQSALENGERLTQSEVLSACGGGVGKNKLVAILKNWSVGESRLWRCEAGANNSKIYSHLSKRLPPL